MPLLKSFVVAILATAIGASLAPAEDPDRFFMRGWGYGIDPLGDCKFVLERGKVTIDIPDTPHGLSVELNRMQAPRILRAVEGDLTVQVRVDGQMPARPRNTDSLRKPFYGAGLLLWADDGNYVRLEVAQVTYEGRDIHYINYELFEKGKAVRMGNFNDARLTSPQAYLRLERQGEEVRGALSHDGERWTQLKPLTVKLSNELYAGVAASHNNQQGFSATFEQFEINHEKPTQR